MHFLYPSLAAGFVLIAAPFLVHLINLLRHRRQQWAAMEFLLAAYRKQRKWVVLRQLLLLSLRTLAIALLVAMFAGWISGSRLLDALGGNTQHHVIILDDSFSMQDRSQGGVSAYQSALSAFEGFIQRLSEDEGSHQLTVLRTSRAALAMRASVSAGDVAADISGQTLVPGNREIARVMATSPSPLAASLEPALQFAADLVEHTAADQSHVYVLTDLRQTQWQSTSSINEQIGKLTKLGADLKLIDCGSNPGINLSVTELTPLGDVWAAGVPCRVRVKVHNYSNQTMNDVTMSTSIIRYGAGVVPNASQSVSGTVEPLPDVLFDRIEAGSEAIKVFQVYIDTPGHHAIQVKLPEDVVPEDNLRVCSLPLVESRRLLLIQNSPDDPLPYYIRSAMDPGNSIRTGWTIDLRNTSYLMSASVQDLSTYDVVWLLNLPEFDTATATSLKGYVEQGGGLGVWCGQATRVENYNQQLGGDTGLLPGRLLNATPLKRTAGNDRFDLNLDQPHPITAPLAALGPSMLSSVRMQQALNWEIGPESVSPTVLLRLSDERPLSFVHRVGQGTVLWMLTGLDRNWTNWPVDPTFVVFTLRAAAEMSLAKRPPTSYPVGDRMQIAFDDANIARTVEWMPGTLPPRASIEMNLPTTAEGVPPVLTVDPGTALLEDRVNFTNFFNAGLSELWSTTLDGRPQGIPIPLVVDGAEGNLARIDRNALIQSVRPHRIEIIDAATLSERSDTTGSSARVLFMLAVLMLIMVAEQFTAYWASYHHQPASLLGRP